MTIMDPADLRGRLADGVAGCEYAHPRANSTWSPRHPTWPRWPAPSAATAVDVKALAKPTEDPHFVDAKPSHIVTLNRADVLIEGGAELEIGWLPPLLESARNDKIAAGAPGRISASQGVTLLEVPSTLDRSRATCTRSAIRTS